MGVEGDSRQSDVPALYARPSSSTRLPLHGSTHPLSTLTIRVTTYSGMCSLTSLASSTKRKRVPEPPLDAPREVRRVDRQAVAADAGTGREPHEPERLGRGRVDRRPDVDAELAGEHRELVDERDVHVAERVLEQLHQLGLAGRCHRHDLVDERAVERARTVGTRRGVDARDDLRRVHEIPLGVARVDALGRVAEEEVDAGAQAAGSSRIGRSSSSVVPG